MDIELAIVIVGVMIVVGAGIIYAAITNLADAIRGKK